MIGSDLRFFGMLSSFNALVLAFAGAATSDTIGDPSIPVPQVSQSPHEVLISTHVWVEDELLSVTIQFLPVWGNNPRIFVYRDCGELMMYTVFAREDAPESRSICPGEDPSGTLMDTVIAATMRFSVPPEEYRYPDDDSSLSSPNNE